MGEKSDVEVCVGVVDGGGVSVDGGGSGVLVAGGGGMGVTVEVD